MGVVLAPLPLLDSGDVAAGPCLVDWRFLGDLASVRPWYLDWLSWMMVGMVVLLTGAGAGGEAI